MKKHLYYIASAAMLLAGVIPAHAASEPMVSGVSPVSAAAGVTTAFTVTYSDTEGVASCTFYMNGANQGAMSLAGSTSGVATRSLALTASGSNSLYATCTDMNGNVGVGSTTTVTATVDTAPPSQPGNVSVVTSANDTTPTFSWTVSTDNVAVAGYDVQINGGVFTSIGNTTTFTANALTNGSHSFVIRARDAAENISATATIVFNIDTGITPVPSIQPPHTIIMMDTDANLIMTAGRTELEAQVIRPCEFAAGLAATRTSEVFGTGMDASSRARIENFIGCGTWSTRYLGAGERIGIINSYRAAFGRLPSTSAQWLDVVKIGNGRFTAETSANAEADAHLTFKKIYLRDANMSVQADINAVTVMAYGLRPQPRNLSAEAAATVTFRAVYGRGPSSARDWDAVRATAYSGATR